MVIDVILCIIVSVLIISLSSFYLKNRLVKEYEKNENVEDTLDILKKLNRMIQMPTIFIVMAASAFYIYSKLNFNDENKIFITIFFVFIVQFLGSCINILILDKTYQKIRDTSVTLKAQLERVVMQHSIAMLPLIVLIIIFMFFKDIPESLKIILIVMVVFIVPAIINGFITPMMYKKIFSELKYDDENILDEIREFIKNQDLDMNVIVWNGVNSKQANAMVVGFKKKTLYISDYLMDNLTKEEILAVVAHEVGHIKNKHLEKRAKHNAVKTLSIFLISLFVFLIVLFIDVNTNPMWVIIFTIFLTIIWTVVITTKFTQKQEYEADEYLVKCNMNPNDLINALIKITKLNFNKVELGRFEEKMETHPSISKRVTKLKKLIKEDIEVEKENIEIENTDIETNKD